MTCIDVSLPDSWESLSQPMLRYVLQLMARFSNRHDPWRLVAVAVVRRVAGIKVICRYSSNWLCRIAGKEEVVDAQQLAYAVQSMSWLSGIPESPVRLDRIGKASALPPFPLAELEFSQWLALENLFQGYLFTQDSSLLEEMARILYSSESLSPSAAESLGVFYWWTAVKNQVAAMFPNFFRPSPAEPASEPDPDSLRRSVDSQIRALTKGDVTKEDAVLAMPAIRALTELDAQAREYEELNRKYPHSNA